MTTIKFLVFRAWSVISYAINNFFFKPASPRPLAIFRIGISLVLLLQAFFIRNSFINLFATNGFMQRGLLVRSDLAGLPKLDWFVELFFRFGIAEHETLIAVGFLYIAGLCFLLAGCFSRSAALVCWFLHWCFTNTNFVGSYGADMYSHIFLFYLIWMPSGHAYSLDRFFGRVFDKPSQYARLSLRVLQLHMCISYLLSGLEKASGQQWWNGDLLWIALNSPGYTAGDFHWLAYVPFVTVLGCWATLAIETFYFIMVWPKKTRMVWVFATCFLHIGIAVFMKLHIFGLLMCVPTIALFAISAEPRSQKTDERIIGLRQAEVS